MKAMRAGVICLVLLAAVLPLGSASAEPLGSQSHFVPLAPTRVLDTRNGTGVPAGIVAKNSSVQLRVLGAGGIPETGVTAVALNITAAAAVGPGYIQVFPTGQAQIGASSNLNLERVGETLANLVVVPVGDGGNISIYSEAGAHLLADVLGYFTESPGAATAGRYVAVTPRRLADTRSNTAPGITVANPGDTKNCTDFNTWAEANEWFWYYYPFFGDVAKLDDGDFWPCENIAGQPSDGTNKIPAKLYRLKAGGSVRVLVRGNAPIPATGVSAVVLNVTTDDAEPGFTQVIPTGGPTALGASSNINVTTKSRTVPNTVVVPVGADGTVTIFSEAGGSILVDALGYFTDNTATASTTGLFVALRPERILDTRNPPAKITDAGTATLTLRGSYGIPVASSAVFINVTATDPTGAGYIHVFPTGESMPGSASNLNVTAAGQTVPNAVFATLSASNGQLSIYSSVSTNLLADVAGYFTS